MRIELRYSNALADGQEEFSGEFSSIHDAVRDLVGRYPESFNPANLDFEKVIVDGDDVGIDGLCQAEVALQEFY